MAGEASKRNFRDAMAAATEKYVKQQARNTIALNARVDPACAGYVRVPGPDACEFCVAMGARDTFYRSEATAGGGATHGTRDDRYHAYCNCGIALVFRSSGGLVACDPETGEPVPYDSADILRRYAEAGRPTFAKNRVREAARRRMDRRTATAGPAPRNLAGGAKLPDADFHAAMSRISEAGTMDALKAACAEIDKAWSKNRYGRNATQWNEMRELVERRKVTISQVNREVMADSAWYEDALTRKVHWERINSKDYAVKLTRIVGDKGMARVIHEDVKAILKKTDKTPFEELYAYDLTDKERIERVIDQRIPLEVKPTEKFKAKVSERINASHRVVTLHNHSGSNIPSLADIHGLKMRGDEFGIVACHNGEIFTYRIIGEPAEGYIIENSTEASAKFMQSFAYRMASKGFDAALHDIGELYGVKFERFL